MTPPEPTRSGASPAGTAHERRNAARPPRVLMLLEHGAASHWWEASLPLLQASGGVELLTATVFERGPLHENLEAHGSPPVLTLGCRTSRDYPRAVWRLARLIRQQHIDIIHANETIAATLSGLAGRLAGRGVLIFHRHHNIIEVRPQVFFSRWGSRLTHFTMAVSKSSAHHAQTIDKVPAHRVRVAYNGVRALRSVPVEDTDALRARLGIPARAPVITVVARLWIEKGHRTLLEAVPTLTAALTPALTPVLAVPPHLVFVGGSGPEEASLRRMAETLSPAVVHFAGHQPDVAPWYALSDVVVVPSLQESFSLSAVEAMTLRRPVVASGIGGLTEVVADGVTGLLVEAQNPTALAGAILRLLQDPTLAAQMGEAGYQRFRSLFTIEAMVASWQAVYDEVTSLKPA